MLYFLAGLLITLAVYLPTAVASFIRHDDYCYFFAVASKTCHGMNIYSAYVDQGRLLLAELQWCTLPALFMHSPDMRFFVLLRLGNLLVIAAAFGMFASWLAQRTSLGKSGSIFLSTLIFTLPGYHFWAAQALSAANAFALLFALAASLLVCEAPRPFTMKSPDFLLKNILAAEFLLLTLFTYQPHALMFFLPAAALLFFASRERWPDTAGRIGWHLLLFLFSLALYLLLQKKLVFPFYHKLFPAVVDLGQKRLEFSLDLSGLWKNLLGNLANPKAYNLWFLENSPTIANFFKLFLGGSLLAAGVTQLINASKGDRPENDRKELLQRIGLGLALWIAAQWPQILLGKFDFYRVTVHLSSFLVFGFIWSIGFWCRLSPNLFGKKNIRTALLAVFAVCAALLARHNAYKDFALISRSEFDYLKKELAPLLEKKAGSAFIIRPFYTVRDADDEHTAYTSFFENNYGLKGMIKRIWLEEGKNFEDLDIINFPQRVMWVKDRAAIWGAAHRQLRIDLNRLYQLHAREYPPTRAGSAVPK